VFKLMWDTLPLPVYIRDQQGMVLYANTTGRRFVGGESGPWPAAWQLRPKQGPRPSEDMQLLGLDLSSQQGPEAEPDLPTGAADPNVSLPPVSSSHHLVLLDPASDSPRYIDVHRMPFWLTGANGARRAAVLYMAQHL